MLTRIAITKKNKGLVQITLTDHSEYIYKHELFMIQTLINYGAKIIAINSHGKILAEIGKNWNDFYHYIDKYICNEYLVEETYDNLAFIGTKTYYSD